MPAFEDLNSVLTWYQNHVGAYDKAKWEQTVEERILHGINHIPTKSAKLAYDLIDLDLVQGSSFPKPKPKHGLFTVTRHALLRFLFLPFYHQWWSAQTSPQLYLVFILLYSAQLLNVVLYLTQPGPGPLNGTVTEFPPAAVLFGPLNEGLSLNVTESSLPIQTSDILSPIVLMIILTILHSQIVATHWSNSSRGSLGGLLRGTKAPPAVPLTRDQLTRTNTNFNNSRRNSGGGSKPIRKVRRNHSRLPPSRRRSSHLTLGSLSLAVPSLAEAGEVSLSRRHSGATSLSPSSNKKVFFEDEPVSTPKSFSPSNSDRDEGIPEELVHPCCVQSCTYALPTTDPIIQKNLAEALSQFRGDTDRDDLFLDQEAVCTCQAPLPPPLNQLTAANLTSLSGGRVGRSSLRNRNPSKQSTTTPSVSSNNNGEDSSTDEEAEEGDDPEEEGLEDEDIRSKSEWTAVTTNSEDEDYVEEEVNNSDDEGEGRAELERQMNDHPFAWEFQQPSSKSQSPSCASPDKVSCTIWEGCDAKKADLSVLDISALIIAKVERARENSDYLYLGICFSMILAFLPALWRLNIGFEIDDFDILKTSLYLTELISLAYGNELRTRIMICISCFERLSLSLCVFFLLAVAEKTYKQRFLYSKLFSRLTSTRKSRKSGIPHFRLNKVRNIKTWLSVRSYLQRRGPQRSVDTIVSATFIGTLVLICFLSVELLKDSSRMYYLYNLEVIGWSLCLGIYLMRFMTLGSRISQKYRNLSVIITEQLNLYLKMEQKPHKKDELLVANNVLKLASELLKELEDPFKISSFASNPYFYNVTRLVILSAFSGVLSEILGFKLKLYKIKLK